MVAISTDSERSVAGNKPQVDKQKTRGHPADRMLRIDKKADGKAQEGGVIPLSHLKASPVLILQPYSLTFLEVSALPAAEGLECQAEEFDFVIK